MDVDGRHGRPQRALARPQHANGLCEGILASLRHEDDLFEDGVHAVVGDDDVARSGEVVKVRMLHMPGPP